MPMNATPLPLTGQQQEWYESACNRLSGERLRDLLVDLVNIHSPTGAEAEASRYLSDYLARGGFQSFYQSMTPTSGNVLARLPGTADGATLMFYAPIDTHLESNADYDLPYVGRELREDMLPCAQVDGDLVVGLGAANPKCMVACIVEAAQALKDAGVPMVGELRVGSAAGGMPVDLAFRDHAGMSNGIYHLLTRGGWPDFAVIVKPWWWVYAEEPGMAWFKVTVHGDLGYAGIPRGVPHFRSSILPAATLIADIEEWLLEYTRHNTAGTVEPHGWISSIQSGWPEKPAFPSAATEIYLDVRVNPRTTPADVRSQFARFMASVAARYPDMELDWDMIGCTPGGMTDPSNWIVQSTLRAWEYVEGKAHGQPPLMAGQTDGAVMRRLGVPTARIGYPWPSPHIPERFNTGGLGGMGAAWVPDMVKTARALVYVAIDTLTRTRQELGLKEQISE